MNLFIIRHAQALTNIGKAKTPNDGLSELGRKQADTLAAFFKDKDIKVDKIYSSPLRRTIQTATPLSLNSEKTITLVPELSEIFNEEWTDYRDHDWESCDYILNNFNNVNFIEHQDITKQWWPNWPENGDIVMKRVRRFYDTYLMRDFDSTKNIIIIGHGQTTWDLQTIINPDESIEFPNTGIYECSINSSGEFVRGKLHTNHLGSEITY